MCRNRLCLLAAVTVCLLLAPANVWAQVRFGTFGTGRTAVFLRPGMPGFSLGGPFYGGYGGLYPRAATWAPAFPSSVSPGLAPYGYGMPGAFPGYMGSTAYFSGPVVLPGWAASSDAVSRPNEFSIYNPPRMRPQIEPALRVEPDTAIRPAAYAAETSGREATIQVIVPTPDAEVWVAGAPTAQGGTLRNFVSPPLSPGEYTYDIRARWQGPGGMQTGTRQITVQPGGAYRVNFTQ